MSPGKYLTARRAARTQLFAEMKAFLENFDGSDAANPVVTLPTDMRGAKVKFGKYSESAYVTSKCGQIDFALYKCRKNDNQRHNDGEWWGIETRTDSTGIEWCRNLPAMVQDDFGNLVVVPL